MFGKESSITVSVLHICVSIKTNCEEETVVDSWEILGENAFSQCDRRRAKRLADLFWGFLFFFVEKLFED